MGAWEIKISFNLLPANSLLRDFHVVPGSCSLSSLLLLATSGPCLTTDPRGTHASFSSCCELRGDVPKCRSTPSFFDTSSRSSREREVVVSHLILLSVPSLKKSSSCRKGPIFSGVGLLGIQIAKACSLPDALLCCHWNSVSSLVTCLSPHVNFATAEQVLPAPHPFSDEETEAQRAEGGCLGSHVPPEPLPILSSPLP